MSQLAKRDKETCKPGCKPVKRRVELPAFQPDCFDTSKTVYIKGDEIKIKDCKRKVDLKSVHVRPSDVELVVVQPDFIQPKDKLKIKVKRERCKVKPAKLEVEVDAPVVHLEQQDIKVVVKKGKCKRCKPDIEVICDKPKVICVDTDVRVKRCGKPKVTCKEPCVTVVWDDCADGGKKPKRKLQSEETEQEDDDLQTQDFEEDEY